MITLFLCRCYFDAEQTSLPSQVKECVELFQSDAMFLLLSNLTGLKLHELACSSSEDNDSEPDDSGGKEDGKKTASSNGSGGSTSNSVERLKEHDKSGG